MTKYSGFFLSVLLAVFCLWINLWRYPAVWVMLNGKSPTAPVQSGDSDYSGPAEPISVQNGPISPKEGEIIEAGPTSRAPTPVVLPVSRPKEEEPAQNEEDGVFRHAALSRPADDSDEAESAGEKKVKDDEKKVKDKDVNNNIEAESKEENNKELDSKKSENDEADQKKSEKKEVAAGPKEGDKETDKTASSDKPGSSDKAVPSDKIEDKTDKTSKIDNAGKPENTDLPKKEEESKKIGGTAEKVPPVRYPAAGSPGTMKLSDENPAYAEEEPAKE